MAKNKLKRPRNRPPVLSTFIYNTLRQSILSGEYAVGSKLPSENSLSKHFKATRITVRSALKRLGVDGLLQPRPGVGWHVIANTPNKGVSANPVLLVGNNDPESVECLEAARQVFLAENFETRFCVYDDSQGLILGNAAWEQLSGAIFYSGAPIPDDIVSRAQTAGVPLVCCMLCSQESYDTVSGDVRNEIQNAANHLLPLGYKTFGYVSAESLENSDDPSFNIRRKGYEDAVEEAGMEKISFNMKWNGWLDNESVKGFYAWLDQEILSRPGPRCLFCATGNLVQTLSHLLEQRNQTKQTDTGIAGSIEIPMQQFLAETQNPLLLYRIPYQDIGTVAAKRLLARINGDVTPATCSFLPTEIIETGSIKNG